MVVYEELEVIEKMKKNQSWGSGEGGKVGQGGGERIIEVVVEMPKKVGGGGGGGERGSGWM